MTTRNRVDWLTLIVRGGIGLGCTAALAAILVGAAWLLWHGVDWLVTVAIPAVVVWSDDDPQAFYGLMIGLVALSLLATMRRKGW